MCPVKDLSIGWNEDIARTCLNNGSTAFCRKQTKVPQCLYRETNVFCSAIHDTVART